jgi:hypothetical protein
MSNHARQRLVLVDEVKGSLICEETINVCEEININETTGEHDGMECEKQEEKNGIDKL